MNEEALVTRARQGDGDAWTELVSLHQEGVFRMAYLHLKDRDEAEDVAQATFVRAYRKLHQFESGRPLRPWLLSICSNLARNRKRSLARYWRAIKRFARQDPGSRRPEGGSEAQRLDPGAAAAQELWELLQEMKEQDREVIYYRYFMDLSVAETGQLLGVPNGTVKSRLHRALARLEVMIRQQAPHLAQGG